MEVNQVIQTVVVGLVALILATAVHEFAHVAMARWLGDDTGTRMGRYTLNPLAHIDWVWTVILPGALLALGGVIFGAGKPAPYNPNQLDRRFNGKRITLRTAEILVAAAGPASNVVMAILTVPAIWLLHTTGVFERLPYVFTVISFFLTMNIVLAIFNMIPIPPLDGSKILYNLLPDAAARKYEAMAQPLSWVLLLVILGGGRYVLGPLVSTSRDLLIGWIF